jgi:DNA-binding transcriptional ArsR family regulator
MLALYLIAKLRQRTKMESDASESGPEQRIRRLLAVLLLSELALFVATVFIGKLSQVHERYLIVLLPPFPLWLSLRWHAARQQSAALILTAAALLAVVVTAARLYSIMEGQSRLAFPYAEMTAEIASFAQAPLEVLADRPENAANVAMRLPGASVCDGRPRTFRMLVVADDSATVSELGRSLEEGYEPIGEVRILERPWRWKPDRRASLAMQLWQVRPIPKPRSWSGLSSKLLAARMGSMFFYLHDWFSGAIVNQMVKYNSATLNRTFAALADPTRRRILAHLARGDKRVTHLARPHAMSLPAVSKHLRVLENAGLLRRRRYGRIHEMQLEAKPLQQAAQWVEQYREFWEGSLDRLAEYLEKTNEAMVKKGSK